MTSPINPLDIINKTEPAASTSKRRSPTSLSSVDESVEIQPIKRAAVVITPKTEILKLLLAQIVDEGEEIRFNETPDYILVSTPLHNYQIFPNGIQKMILFGELEKFTDGTLIFEFNTPIRCRSISSATDSFEFNLSLLSIFFTKNPIADKIANIFFNTGLRNIFIAHATTYVILPYFSDSSFFLNPAYANQTATLLEYMKQMNSQNGSMLYICESAGIDPAQIQSKIGLQLPHIATIDSKEWSRQRHKSFAQLEAEEAQNITTSSPTGTINTRYLRQLAQFKETCSPLYLFNGLVYKVGSFDFESTGDIRFFDNPVTASLLNSGINPPNYDESKTFKDNLINLFTTLNPSLRQLANCLEILDDKTCLLKAGAGTLKISFASEHADSELLPDFLLADTLEGISREETQPIAPTESTIPLNTFPADLLRILSWQISFTETKSVVFNSSTNTYTATLPDGQKHTYSLKPCHFQALTGDLAPDEYLNAFIEPIVCNIQGVEFNFSLFSLLFSKDLARYIKKEKVELVFLVHATNYLLTPKTHPYINRDYKYYSTNFYCNLKSLIFAKSLQKFPIDPQLYGKMNGKINSDFYVIVNVPIKFNCDFFSVQEAGLAVSNKYEKTKLTPYLEAWKRIREKNPGMRTFDEKMFLKSRNDNSTIEIEIENFISNNVISFLFKQNFRLLLSAFIKDKDFNVSYLNFSHEPRKHIYKVSTSDNETYELDLDEHQYSALNNVTNYNLLELEAFSKSIAVTLKSSHGDKSFHTSLLSLLYQRNPYSEWIVNKLRKLNNPSLAAAFNTFLTNATEFALQPFDNILFLNPDYIHLVEAYYRNLCDIAGSNDYVFPCGITRSKPFYQTGSVTWLLRRYMQVTPSSIYSEEIKCLKGAEYLNTRHVTRWINFFGHIKLITFNEAELTFEYNGSTYSIKNEPVALHPVFLEINRDNAAPPLAPRAIPTLPLNPEPAIQSATIDPVNTSPPTQNPFKDALKALLFPLVSETFDYKLNENGIIAVLDNDKTYQTYGISLNPIQRQFLEGNITWDYFGLSQDLIAPIDVWKGKNNIGKTSIFAVFYNDNELTAKLVARLKICPHKLAFLAHGITFALHPIIHTGPTCNPKIIPLLTNLYRHFVEINNGSNVFPGSQHKSQIVVGGTEWNFSDTTITTQSRYYLASSEANECTAVAAISSPPILQFNTEHTSIWHKFFKAVKYISSNVDSITFMNGTERTKWKGTFLSTKPEFKLIVGIPLDPEKDKAPPVAAPLPPAPPVEAKLPPAPPVSSTPPSVPNTPAIEKLRIANVIETYWFQNPVNYSRWIKLLQKSRAVFAFDSLPNELMEPLKAFKKEHIEEVLKYLGVGVDITGNLENDLIEKAVPTLLRVKAAEFKLVKKTFGEEKERKEIEFKPCYLVKPGPRFVHVIKVIARFDEYGLLSGFLMAEGNVESNISLDAFNKLVEEGKNKRAIVLQRETIKLTEEAVQAPEISPTRKKREREEVEKKEDESAEKVAKGDPILPPVPVARPNLKRPSTENTVKPKAPKESKFNDKGDIKTDKPRALGKPQDGGIIAPPEMIDQPKLPDLQQALSLDELFSALSANAGAQINHVVKISLNQLKAIFSEEPLSYEGLELITKLENTPVPTTPCLVPKAKSYQWDFVMQAKRRENAGLGSILAPYMGLGKTWIYISKIILSLYEDTKGHHLVITPKPLRKTITEDAIVILNDARLNAFVHLKSMKWGNWCADSIIRESNPREITFLLSLLGLFDEETFNKIMAGRGPITNTLVLTYVKAFHQYPSKLKRLYEHCKSIAPKSLPERGHFDEKGLERILKFSSSRIVKCEEGKDLVKHAKSDESKIIIASYEQAEHLASDPVSTPGCASITFDEAQYIHNPEIKIAKAAETLLKVLNPKAKMAVTGTPIENGIEDLFQLVGLMAPELKCPSILSTLHTLSSGASRFTKFKDREQALTHLIKFHGHMQAYLTRVSQNLVLILKKDDPRVKEAWGDGAKVEYARENISISALAEQKYREAHELFKTRRVDTATGKKLDSNMAYYSRVASIMLDPELKAESLTKKDPAVQRLLKWIKSEPEMAKIDELIARSAILSSIVYSPKTQKAINEKRVELIFVANIAVGKVIRKVLKRKFPESQGTESYLMYGDQKDEKKDKIIDSLKENGKSKFGILSIESGSTGFSIPDAYVTIMQTLSYNVATELQAIGRMDRATSKGDKYVIYPRFGIFSEEHIPVVQEIKKLTFKSFFSPAATQLERLQDIAQLNRHNIYQSYLNEKRDAQEALAEMEEIDAITESLLTAIDEEELKAFVEKLTPPLPIIAPPPARIAAIAKTTLAPPLRIAGNKLFKMPLPNTLANEDKVRLAQFIQENKKALEGPLKEIYNQFKNPELRNLVRTGVSMPTPESARVHQILMNLIQDAKQSVRSIDDIGIDRFKIEGQDYVLEGKSHPERIKRVKVVSSINGPFEILI